MHSTVDANRGARFDTTSWSLVFAAAERGSPEAAAALSDLCARYWYPVYAFIRRQGHPAPEAEDLTQSFFERVLSTDWLHRADSDRGRFRSFLLISVKHFLANEHDARLAAKRGGGFVHVDIDAAAAAERFVNEGAADPEKLYAKRWAISVLEQALRAVRDELTDEGREDHLPLMTPFLTGQAARGEYARAAAKMNTSEGALRVAVHRLRSAFRSHLRRVVGQTVPDPREVDEEIRYLIAALSG